MDYRHQGHDPLAHTVYQHQRYDQPHQFYNQSADAYYPYTYSNPMQPHPYHIVNVQPSPGGEQEPNPPGVFVQPPPNAYYQSIGYCAAAYNVATQQGGVDVGFATVHQPIVQSSYNNGMAQTHPAPIPSFSPSPCIVHVHGRGHSLQKHQVQTVLTQVGPSQPNPQPSLGPTPVPLTSQAQSASPPKHMCQLCKVECNTPEILNQHNSGKKHMKKLKTFEESQKTDTFEPGKILASKPQQLPQKSSLPSQDMNEVEKRKVEVAKHLWCELCKANCNNLENFNKHMNGRKHQKKMKSQVDVQMDQHASEPELKPEVPSQTLPSQEAKEESKVAIEKVKACGSKRKMKGDKVRSVKPKRSPLPKEELLCELCEVQCETQVAFQSHIVGKEHLLNAKRFLSENKALGQEVFRILKHAIQALEQNGANLESVRAKDVGGGVAM